MKVVKKIDVKLSPRTDHIAFLNHKTVDLAYSILKFNDGSLRVKLDNPEAVVKGGMLYIAAYLQNMDDVMVVAQIQDIVRRLTNNVVTTVLTVSSPLYSRYDRVMLQDSSDSFGAQVFAKAINSLGFNIVRYLDCHSDVLVKATTNGFDIAQNNVLELVTAKYPHLKGLPTIAPDKGAVKKLVDPDIIFDKVRDVTNGQITGMCLAQASPKTPCNTNYLVVDDLCEGGRTFLEVAKEFKKVYPSPNLSLYVTHGLFTNNAIPKLLEKYSNIYVYIMKASVYYALQEHEAKRVNVLYLVDDTN